MVLNLSILKFTPKNTRIHEQKKIEDTCNINQRQVTVVQENSTNKGTEFQLAGGISLIWRVVTSRNI